MRYGRQIYFLCPEDAVRNDLVFQMIRNEFEVYVLDDPVVAKEIVADSDGILLVNVDATVDGTDWQEYLIELKGEPRFSRVGVGVITSRADDEARRVYIMEIGVDCGVVTLKPGLQNVAHVILEILRSNDAIGRRNAVRVDCDDDPEVKCLFRSAEDTIEGHLVNLSSQGLACTDVTPRAPRQQEYFSAIELDLHGEKIQLSGRHFDIREDDGRTIHVVLFDRAADTGEREKVHRFIQRRLQESVNSTLTGLQHQLSKRRMRRAVRIWSLLVASLAAFGALLFFLLYR